MLQGRLHSPQLTIGLPVYNGEKYLRETLDCLLAQSFSDFEIIICDDASTDRTPAICATYLRLDPRIRYHRSESNVGATANFHLAFRSGRAPLFKWAAHDDLYHPHYLATCVEVLRRNSDVVLAHSATSFIDETGKMFPFDPETGQFRDPISGEQQKPDAPAIGDHAEAARRFWQVLSGARWGSHIFGVVRREALERTKILGDSASGDRSTLAELALIGRFQSTRERFYLKRFHESRSWALTQDELKSFPRGTKNYSRRRRQLASLFWAPFNKPIGLGTKAVVTLMVAVHCAKILADMVRGKDARYAAQGHLWPGVETPLSVKGRAQ